MELKNTKLKQLLVSFVAIGTLLGGCADAERMKFGPQPVFDTPVKPVPVPDFSEQSELSLINRDERLRVGASIRIATDFFPKPPRAFEFRDRPPAFGPEFRTTGWEDQKDGYGIISSDNRVTVAVRERYNAEEDLVAEVADSYTRIFGTEQMLAITGDVTRYWFWESNNHVLMICAVQTNGKTFNLTEAIGTKPAMEALRMVPATAVLDKNRADNAWKDQQAAATQQ